MNLSQIQFLLEAAECHSIHQVAERNNISPQGASKSIKSLETELGIDLIDRSTKGVYLTEMGEQLKPYFENILQSKKEIEKLVALETSKSQPQISGVINLVVTPRFADSYLGSVLKAFKGQYPKVQVKIDAMSNDKVFQRIKSSEGISELGIVAIANVEPEIKSLSRYMQREKMQFISYCTKKLYMCGRKEVLKRFGEVFHINEPADVTAYEYGGLLDSYSFPCNYQIDSISVQRGFINQYDVVGAYSLDEFDMHFNTKKHAYIPIVDNVTLTYGSLTKYAHTVTEAEKVFLQTLYDYFAEEDQV